MRWFSSLFPSAVVSHGRQSAVYVSVFAIGITVAVLSYVLATKSEVKLIDAELKATTNDRLLAFVNAGLSLEAAVAPIVSALQQPIPINQATVQALGNTITTYFPQIGSVSYSPLVWNSSRGSFEVENVGNITCVGPATPARDFYFPIAFSTLFSNGSTADHLLDVVCPTPSNTIRRDMALTSLKSGSVIAGPLGFDEDSDSVPGVELYFPVNLTTGNTSEVHNVTGLYSFLNGVKGLLSIRIQLSSFAQFAFTHLTQQDVYVEVWDLTETWDGGFGDDDDSLTAYGPDNPQLLFAIEPACGLATGAWVPYNEARSVRMDSQTVKFFGRNYLIKFYALPAFYSSRESHLPVILLIVLLFPTILVAVVVNVMVKWMTNMAAFEAERAASESKQRLALAQTARAAYEGTLRYACHELRNPLHAVCASLGFIREEAAELSRGSKAKKWGAIEEHITTMENAVASMQRLTNDVLDLTKLQQGKLEIKPVHCELYPLIDDTVQTYKSMAATGVACEVIVDDQVPSKVFVDPVRLKQILSNALTNSLKHTDSGTVTVQAHIVPIPIPGAASTKPEDYILFQVIDTGDGLQGMDPKRLFDPTETFDWSCMLQPSQFPKGVLGHIHRNADDVIPILPEGPHCLEAFNSSVRGLNSNTPSEAVARSHASALIMGEAAKHARMGSNLGLPITLRLAQAMRASVGLLETSTGTTFWFAVKLSSDTSDGIGQSMLGISFISTDDAAHVLISASSTGGSAMQTLTFPDCNGRKAGSKPTVKQSSVRFGKSSTVAPEMESQPSLPSHRLSIQSDVSSEGPLSSSADTVPTSSMPLIATVSMTSRSSSYSDDTKRPSSKPLLAPIPQLPSPKPPQQPHVLFVDDDATNRRIGKRMLERAGAIVTTLNDGDEMIAYLSHIGILPAGPVPASVSTAAAAAPKYVSGIVTDIHMKRVNGDEACAAIRKAGVTLPMFAMSGNCSPDEFEHYKSIGFQAALPKPFTADQLASLLRQLPKPFTADQLASLLRQLPNSC